MLELKARLAATALGAGWGGGGGGGGCVVGGGGAWECRAATAGRII